MLAREVDAFRPLTELNSLFEPTLIITLANLSLQSQPETRRSSFIPRDKPWMLKKWTLGGHLCRNRGFQWTKEPGLRSSPPDTCQRPKCPKTCRQTIGWPIILGIKHRLVRYRPPRKTDVANSMLIGSWDFSNKTKQTNRSVSLHDNRFQPDHGRHREWRWRKNSLVSIQRKTGIRWLETGFEKNEKIIELNITVDARHLQGEYFA